MNRLATESVRVVTGNAATLRAAAHPTKLPRFIWSLAVIAVIAILVAGPLYAVITTALQEQFLGTDSGWTLAHFEALLSGPTKVAALNSLVVSIGTTVLTVTIAGVLAWLNAMTNVSSRKFIGVAAITPMFLSALVGATAWSQLASPNVGYINALLRSVDVPITVNVHTTGGVIFVMSLYYVPIAYVFINNAFLLSNSEYEEAARVSGASEWTVARTVTFPLITPALLSTSMFVLVVASENFPVTMILGSQGGVDYLPTRIFRLVSENRPGEAAALGFVLLIALSGLTLIQRWYLAKRSFVTVAGKGMRAKRVDLGRWRVPALSIPILYFVLAFALPVIALLQGAFRKTIYIGSAADFLNLDFSADTFVRVATSPSFIGAIGNTFVIGFGVALLGMLTYFFVSYSANRGIPGARIVEFGALVPLAVPAIVLSLGLLWFWLRSPIPLYGTFLIIVLAYVTRFLPQGYIMFNTPLLQLDKQLEEGARVAGASSFTATRTVTVPLLSRTFTASAILFFIFSFRELTVALYLVTDQTTVMSMAIYNAWQNGNWAQVASMSLVFGVILCIITLATRRWTDRVA